MSSFTVVDAGNRGVLKTFGEVTGTFDPGILFQTPFVTSVVDVDVKTHCFTKHQRGFIAAPGAARNPG
jgi:regulator of protease activity HflC (stomatin/prohibitin superfamily)